MRDEDKRGWPTMIPRLRKWADDSPHREAAEAVLGIIESVEAEVEEAWSRYLGLRRLLRSETDDERKAELISEALQLGAKYSLPGGRSQESYKTFLSPLHRELINRGLQLAESVEEYWGREDRVRSEAALNAVRALLEGEGTREDAIFAQKRIAATAKKWHRRMGKMDWTRPYSAVLLVAAVARLAASEYPKTQAQIFEQCLNLWRIVV